MSHLPFVLQMAMGIAEPPDVQDSRRVQNPTAATPTTFDNNWDYCENGPCNPQPQEGIVTFMGPPKTEAAGDGLEWPKDHVHALKMAVQIFRNNGYVFQVPNCELEPEDKEKLSESERELHCFENCYDDFLIRNKNNEPVASLDRNSGWLFIRCTNEDAINIVEGQDFQNHFALARVSHSESELCNEDGCTITQRTGNGQDRDSTRVGTLFELKLFGKVISKCLCSYYNGEMDNVGPTIDQFETAAEWRKHGHGTSLMEEIEGYFEDIFDEIMRVKRVKFNVCYVTNFAASRWFQNRGFSDWDGMGEELGKILGE